MKKRVLICDDDADILFICSYIFEKQDFEVHTRNHCNQILEMVETIQPDIILMDNWIPDTGGIVAAQTIKGSDDFNHIPIVFFSANNDIKALAKEAKADAYLAKPFDLDELEKLIDHLLENDKEKSN